MLEPLRSDQAFLVGVGRAADPEMFKRRCSGEIAVLAAFCVSGDRSENVESRRLYTVGTTVKNVIGSGFVVGNKLVSGWELAWGRNGAANRDHTAVALKGKRNSIEEPEKRGVRIALMVPWMWCRGRTCRRWSVGE